MPNLRETYDSTRHWVKKNSQRINPEGLTVSTTAASLSGLLWGVQGAMTLAMHELSNEVNPDLKKFIVIGTLGIINALSIAAETGSLRSKNYSASPLSSFFNIVSGKALGSSALSHLVNYTEATIINPINIAAVATSNSQLFWESELSAAYVFTGYSIFVNTLILTGATKFLTEPVRKVRVAATQRVRQSPRAQEVFRRLSRKH